MSSDQRLVSLQKAYPGCSWNLSEALESCSNDNNGVLLALLPPWEFESGKVPEAFEAVAKDHFREGEVICDMFLNSLLRGRNFQLSTHDVTTTLSFSLNRELRRFHMEGKLTYTVGNWTEEVDSKGRLFTSFLSVLRTTDVSVILKRTPMLLQENEDGSAPLENYYDWMGCLSKTRLNKEKGLVRNIAEFVGPAPVLWLEEGDIVLLIGPDQSRIVRPRKAHKEEETGSGRPTKKRRANSES